MFDVLALLVRSATFFFSLILLGLLDYLLFYFKHSLFIRPLRVLGIGFLLLAVASTIELVANLGALDPTTAHPASQALFLLFLFCTAVSLSLFKQSFEKVEWLQEQWISQLRKRAVPRR